MSDLEKMLADLAYAAREYHAATVDRLTAGGSILASMKHDLGAKIDDYRRAERHLLARIEEADKMVRSARQAAV